jgi:anti-sigma factor (TIGR02949 family)
MGKTIVNCDEARERLDAYAIGALDETEADELTRHLGECLACWEELGKSQRTASLLALSVPIHQAPPGLRERLMAQAERERRGVVAAVERRPSLWERLRPGLRTTARAAAVAGVVALVFSGFLQVQMSGLRGDKNDLQDQLSVASTEIEQQRQIMSVLSASDTRKVPIEASTTNSSAESVYNWSRANDTGFIVCSDFPSLPSGSVYQAWFTAEGRSAEPIATFVPQDGGCQIPIDMSRLAWRPAGIGISVEQEGGSVTPSSSWFAYATFARDAQEGSGRSGGNIADMALAAFGP